MVKVRKAGQRGITKIDWLESYHSFSFGEYYDPDNMGFGPLRVINDDTVQPLAGFPTHPHRDMEIVTIVTQGVIAHRDSTGSEGVIRVGEIQKMSAGTGILHSEYNASDKVVLKLFQIWIDPKEKGLKPAYEDMRYEEAEKKNKLLLVASGDPADGVVYIHQDAKIFLSDLDQDVTQSYLIPEEHGLYLRVINGKILLGENELISGDEIMITETDKAGWTALENSGIILFDVAMKF
jgi:quercetin 2,3-dioxygenase